jgi:hypothetical protein
VPTESPVSTTLVQGQFTLLHRARFQRCRVTITAISNAEVGGVLLRTTTGLPVKTTEIVGTEVFLRIFQTILGATIEATTPEGVASLDITYVVKTGSDAGSSP